LRIGLFIQALILISCCDKALAGCGDHLQSRVAWQPSFSDVEGSIRVARQPVVPLDPQSPGCTGATCGRSLPAIPWEPVQLRMLHDQQLTLLGDPLTGFGSNPFPCSIPGHRVRLSSGFPPLIDRPPRAQINH